MMNTRGFIDTPPGFPGVATFPSAVGLMTSAKHPNHIANRA